MTSSLRPYPIPVNDASRTRVVDAMDLDSRRKDPFFTYVTDVLKDIFDAPIAYVSLMTGDTQRFLHCNGANVDGTSREVSLCAFTVAAKKSIILHDTWLDPRSVSHPAVVDGFKLRFSASAPVVLSSGFCLGTLCAVDMVPHEPPTEKQIANLDRLAAMVARFYEIPAEPDPERAAALRKIVDDAQEEFLSLVGHELRTPLNGICGIIPLLEPTDEDSAEIKVAIASSADLLSRIVDSILLFTELKSGDLELDETPLDVADTLREAVISHRALIRLGGKNCDISDVPPSLPICGDRAKLELAFSCIVSNFVVHGGRNARIKACRLADGEVEITISDDGNGISADRERWIWEAFGTGQSVRTRSADGIGLGLPMARRIIELHGGDLELFKGHPGLIGRLRLPAWRSTTWQADDVA